MIIMQFEIADCTVTCEIVERLAVSVSRRVLRFFA